MRSPSRGTVTLRSADPEAPPRILFNYMSTAQDWEDFRTCIRLTREIIAQPALQPFAGDEIQPGNDATSDEAIDEFIRSLRDQAHIETHWERLSEVTLDAAPAHPPSAQGKSPKGHSRRLK